MFTVGAQNLMIRAIFFDLYCTLIDIHTDENDMQVYDALARYLAYHSVVIQPEELRKVFFDLVEQQLSQSEEAHPEVDIFRIIGEIMEKYGKGLYSDQSVLDTTFLFRSLSMRRFGLFPNVTETLDALSGKYRLALISDAQWTFTEPEMRMLGLDRFFHTVLLSSRYGYKKPDARLFFEAMQRLGVTPQESVYIGDNLSKDMVGAKSAGMKFILFQREWREAGGFVPDAWMGDYRELPDLLKRFDGV